MGNDGVQLLFFSEREDLNFLRRMRSDAPTVDYRNVDPFIGTIIADGKATLKELKETYTLEEAFDLWEIIAVNRYNEYLAVEYAKKQGANK